jgi:hypothetical protein
LDQVISKRNNGIMMVFEKHPRGRNTLTSDMYRRSVPRGIVSPFSLAAWQRIALSLLVLAVIWMAIAWAVNL